MKSPDWHCLELQMVWIRFFVVSLILRTVIGQGVIGHGVLSPVFRNEDDLGDFDMAFNLNQALFALSNCLDNFLIPLNANCDKEILANTVRRLQERSRGNLQLTLEERLQLASLTCQANTSCVGDRCTCNAGVKCVPIPRMRGIGCQGENRIFQGILMGLNMQEPNDIGDLSKNLQLSLEQGTRTPSGAVRRYDCDWKKDRHNRRRHLGAMLGHPIFFGIAIPTVLNYLLLKT